MSITCDLHLFHTTCAVPLLSCKTAVVECVVVVKTDGTSIHRHSANRCLHRSYYVTQHIPYAISTLHMTAQPQDCHTILVTSPRSFLTMLSGPKL